MFTFDDSPVMYLTASNLLLIFTAFLSIYSFWNVQLFQRKGAFIGVLLLFSFVLILFRLPIIVFNQAFNPDENMFVVGAMTLAQDSLYWEAVDGGSSGPFNFYIITFFCKLFKQPYDYVSARIVGVTLLVGSIVFNILALRNFFSTSIAFLSTFPAIAFLSTTRYLDFIHFSSEHLPIFLLSVIAYLYAKISTQISVKTSTVFLLGFVAGLLIFTKVQVIPIGFFLTLTTFWLLYQKDSSRFCKHLLFVSLGASIIPLCVYLIAFRYSFVDKAWLYYIKSNLSYGNHVGMLRAIYLSLFDDINIFLKIIVVLFTCLIVYYLFVKKHFRPNPTSAFIIVFLGSTVISIYKTGFVFHHYLLLLIFPTVFVFAFFLHSLLGFSTKRVFSLFSVAVLFLVLSNTLIYPFVNHFVTTRSERPLRVSKTGEEIIKYSYPNEKIVVWGDEGRLYLETKRLQGVRWSNSHWGMYSPETQKVYQQEYVTEFRKESFPVFVDAHTKKQKFMPRAECGYETLTPLKEIIGKEYRFIGEFDEQRVYVRKERFEEVNKTISPQYSSAR